MYKGNFEKGQKQGKGIYAWDQGGSKYNGNF